jgi:hypothetical protein
MSVEELREGQAYLREACGKIGRPDVPATRMSFRVNFPEITGNATRAGTSAAERPIGHGAPAQVAEDMRRFRRDAGLEAFQINFNGCKSLAQLLGSMTLFMQEVKPLVEQ